MARKLLTIFGATGNQGGSVIQTILSNPSLSSTYQIRAVTRDPSKPSSQELASKGADLVKADLKDIESVKKAIEGSYGVFAVTNFWEIQTKEGEFQQGKNIADACLATGTKHLVWSSLPYVTKLTDGVLAHTEHFDSKAMVEEYIEEKKGSMIASYFMPAFFMSNFQTFIRQSADGVPELATPIRADSPWPLIDQRADSGKYVMGIFEAGDTANGAHVNAVSEWTTVEMKTISAEDYAASLPKQIAEELKETLVLISDYSYYGKGMEKEQAESDKFLLKGASRTSLKQYIKNNEPWQWQLN
ncbi:hypothetical protein H2203_004550 [Taxawa tesnikishii (nom. ined.)]|nr:hypothetical protein H2203_004550 [Dothideales sp. JES 119]